MPLHSLFGDRPSLTTQTMPGTNVYIHVNPDEADHMLVDPAYKLEKLKEAHEKLYAMHMAYKEVDNQLIPQVEALPVPYDKGLYENWWSVEKAIRKFDRWFNKVERFESRMLVDPENHDRREKRMTERKNGRWLDNYTYFFGGLSEEEQMYRDYFETDLEEYPEDEDVDEKLDELNMADQGDFNFKHYDFLESTLENDATETIEDVVDKKIFKYKYRMANDSEGTYFRRMDRVITKSLKRAETRDPAVETDLSALLERDS